MNPSICHNNLVWLLTFPLARGGRDVGTAQLEQNKCGCQDERVLITILLRTEAGEPRGRGGSGRCFSPEASWGAGALGCVPRQGRPRGLHSWPVNRLESAGSAPRPTGLVSACVNHSHTLQMMREGPTGIRDTQVSAGFIGVAREGEQRGSQRTEAPPGCPARRSVLNRARESWVLIQLPGGCLGGCGGRRPRRPSLTVWPC